MTRKLVFFVRTWTVQQMWEAAGTHPTIVRWSFVSFSFVYLHQNLLVSLLWNERRSALFERILCVRGISSWWHRPGWCAAQKEGERCKIGKNIFHASWLQNIYEDCLRGGFGCDIEGESNWSFTNRLAITGVITWPSTDLISSPKAQSIDHSRLKRHYTHCWCLPLPWLCSWTQIQFDSIFFGFQPFFWKGEFVSR